MRTHYEVLGVEPDASHAEIRAAYLAAARRHHPDHQSGRPPSDRADAESTMRSLNAAWSVLGDPAARAEYDRTLGAARSGPEVFGAPAAPDGPSRRFVPYQDSDDAEDEAFERWRHGPDEQDPETTPPRLVVALPPVLAVVGVALVLLSVPLGIRAVLAAGMVCLALSLLMFVGAPIFAMIQSQEAERRRRP